MTRFRPIPLVLVALLLVTASCAAFKDAMTSHVDVVARAGNQELSIDELAALMANSEMPLRPDAARMLAQIWVNYQLVGLAGAHGDSLASIENADRGMWSAVAQLRTRKYYEIISAEWPKPDTATFEQRYNDGELLAAAHILLTKQPEGFGPTKNDSIRREADRIAASVNARTFARVAQQRSQDPGSKDRGGDYGVFPRGQMVTEFDEGILSVPPGGITKVIETQFGYHVIRRSTWTEIKDQFAEAYTGLLAQRAESTFFEGVERSANIQVRSSAPKVVKAIAEDIDAYRDDRSVIATSRRGNLTAGRMAQWLAAFPPQSQMRGQVLQAPDSLIPMFVRNIMRSELMLKAADSAGISLDTTETAELRQAFYTGSARIMRQLELAPDQLATAGESRSDREKLAAERVDAYMVKLLRNEGDYVEVPEQMAIVLREEFESRVVTSALDRALAEATRLRAAADSVRGATAPTPPSAVPMPTPNPR